jgi:hypothetical protein
LKGVTGCILTCFTLLGLTPVVSQGKEEKLPVVVAPQPILFSHKQHISIGMACLDCHVEATEKDQAGLPDAEMCMGCHETVKADRPEVKKLAEAYQRKEKIRWVRIYQVPGFVFFSHANHLKSGELCTACHGPIEQREVLAKEVSTSMNACIKCHIARKASKDCYLCHQLGQ